MENRNLNLSEYNIPEDLRGHIPGYIERRKHDYQMLVQFFNEKNWSAIGTIIHKIKGNAAGYGFERLGQISEQIQSALDSKNFALIENGIRDMKNELKNIQNIIVVI